MVFQADSPLRSWLFAPANNLRRASKAMASSAHAVILDLEDAVPVEKKEDARSALRAMLEESGRPNLYVRINGLSTRFAREDVASVVSERVSGIVLPKAEKSCDIQILDWLITQHEGYVSLAAGSLEIIPLLETAAGIENVREICRSSSRIKRLAFGAADFTADLGLSWSADEQELLPYRSALVLASRSAGLEAPVDTPWINIKDHAGMAASARRSRDHGFQGKLCIHPDQLESVHNAYAPSQAEIHEARRIVSAFENAGSAVIELDGRMIDYPVVAAARRLLLDAAEQA